MERISHATADADLHGTGKDGFTEGSPPMVPATIVTDDVANAWQEELARTVELSGQSLTPGGYLQMNEAISRWVSASLFRTTAPGIDAGEWHPKEPAATGGTFWVTQTAGLTGAVQPGSAWIGFGAGLGMCRIGLSTVEIAAQGFDAFAFAASSDTYLALNTTGLIEANAVGNGAMAPTPTLGYRNVLKVITNGTDITSVESLHPAWPKRRIYEAYFTNVDLTDRPAGDETGFLLRLDDSGTNTLKLLPWLSTGASRQTVLDVIDSAAFGTESDVTIRADNLDVEINDLDIVGQGNVIGRVQIRLHDGTAAENTRKAQIHTIVGNVTSISSTNYGDLIPLPHDGANVFALVAAVDSANSARTFSAIHSTLLEKSTALEFGSAALHVNDSAAAGVSHSITTDGTDIFFNFAGEAMVTWRITTMVIVVPLDVTA